MKGPVESVSRCFRKGLGGENGEEQRGDWKQVREEKQKEKGREEKRGEECGKG